MKRFASGLLIILLLCLSACASSETGGQADSSADDEKIIITGGDIGENEILIAEIMKLPVIAKEVTSVDSAGDESTFAIKGALFSDVLGTLGMEQKTLSAIRLVAGDGYMIEVPPEILAVREIIIAYEIDGKPLEEKTKPARLIIPEERAMYWVKNLVKIEILEARETLSLSRLLFMETAFQNMEQHDYTYYDSLDKAVSASDLFKNIPVEESIETVFMKAVDGLEKNEKAEVFDQGYIKFTGVDIPAFMSPDIPKGMYVKDILWLAKGDTGYISGVKALDHFPKVQVDDREGVKLSDLFNEVSMADGESYLFTALDGYNIEIDGGDIARGLIYLRDGGVVSVMFEGLPKNTSVKDLLSIEIRP